MPSSPASPTTLEKVSVDTVEAGFMTKDLALLVGPDQKWLTTTGFLDKVDENLKEGDGLSAGGQRGDAAGRSSFAVSRRIPSARRKSTRVSTASSGRPMAISTSAPS